MTPRDHDFDEAERYRSDLSVLLVYVRGMPIVEERILAALDRPRGPGAAALRKAEERVAAMRSHLEATPATAGCCAQCDAILGALAADDARRSEP